MIGKYPSYQDSDVMWFGEIPSHWNMYPIKHLFSERNERNKDGNTNYLSIVKDKGVILYSEKGNVGNKTSDRPENYKMVYVNDIVINSMNITIGSVGKSIHNGCLSSVYIVLNPNDSIDSSYYDYIFSHKSFQKSLKRISYGIMEIRESLNKIEFYVEQLPFPPLPEQTQIVSFLDTKTQKIDELIDKTEKKIELLKEKRTSLINHCVTKGLNPNVEMKDSGVEWIGEIPSHWDKTKVKFETTIVVDGTHFTPTYTDSGVPFLRVTDIHKKEINLDKVKFISEEEHSELIKRCKPKKGDLLLSKNGTIGLTKIVHWDWDFSIFVSLCLIRFKKTFNKYLFSYFFQSDIVDRQLVESSKKSTVTNLHLDKIRELILIKSPIEEQSKIVEYLDDKTQKIDSTIEKETKRIDLLKEYRQSLISEVVTGKIDVRD
jgi:type I restriction enzyme, S subunit